MEALIVGMLTLEVGLPMRMLPVVSPVPILTSPDVVVVYKNTSFVISLGSGSMYFVFTLTRRAFVLFSVDACNVVMLPPTDAILEQLMETLFAIDAFAVDELDVDAFTDISLNRGELM